MQTVEQVRERIDLRFRERLQIRLAGGQHQWRDGEHEVQQLNRDGDPHQHRGDGGELPVYILKEPIQRKADEDEQDTISRAETFASAIRCPTASAEAHGSRRRASCSTCEHPRVGAGTSVCLEVRAALQWESHTTSASPRFQPLRR